MHRNDYLVYDCGAFLVENQAKRYCHIFIILPRFSVVFIIIDFENIQNQEKILSIKDKHIYTVFEKVFRNFTNTI